MFSLFRLNRINHPQRITLFYLFYCIFHLLKLYSFSTQHTLERTQIGTNNTLYSTNLSNLFFFLGICMQNLDFIVLIRESCGFTQEQIGSILEVTQSAIKKFEKTGTGISHEKVINLCNVLGINPDYLINPNIYPFGENKLYKFFTSEKGILPGFPGLQPLYSIIELNKKLRIISLVPQLKGLNKIIQRSIFEQPTYVIAIKDTYNNLFLLRRKKNTDFLMWAGDLKSPLIRIHEISRSSGHAVNLLFDTINLDDSMYEKFKSHWNDVKIEEIKILFKKAEFYDLIEPDKHETELITILRKYKDKITVKEAINIIEKKIK